MPRRNGRHEVFVPLDLTPNEIPKPPPRRDRESLEAMWARRDRERQDRYERQHVASVNRGIDWSVCVVPGCGKELITWGGHVHRDEARRDSQIELPICYLHAAIVWNNLVRHHATTPDMATAVADLNDRVKARKATEHEEEKREWMARTDGDIYFIKLNDLIKVGWTRDISQRVRSYGASAKLLVYYPGTRDDETNLHRQLTPARAKGREWYEDGPIVHAFIAEALKDYGAPHLELDWTTPKRVVAGKRYR